MLVQVIREYRGDPSFKPGAILDTKDWPARRAEQLIRHRYVALYQPPLEDRARRGRRDEVEHVGR